MGKKFQIEHANAAHRGILHLRDQGRQIETDALFPLSIEYCRKENVFPAAHGIGIYTEQAQQARNRSIDTLA